MNLYIFDSTHDALAAEGLLQEAGYSLRIIPTPRQFSEACGISLLVETAGPAEPLRLIEEAGIEDVLVCSVTVRNRRNVYELIE